MCSERRAFFEGMGRRRIASNIFRPGISFTREGIVRVHRKAPLGGQVPEVYHDDWHAGTNRASHVEWCASSLPRSALLRLVVDTRRS